MASVKLTGPLFDGSAEWILTTAINEARRNMAVDALGDMERTASVFEAPTGRWRSLLHVVHHGTRSIVRPGRLPYNFWLEGIGSRNRTSRFKGYRNWRIVRTAWQRRAAEELNRRIQPAITRIGG